MEVELVKEVLQPHSHCQTSAFRSQTSAFLMADGHKVCAFLLVVSRGWKHIPGEACGHRAGGAQP